MSRATASSRPVGPKQARAAPPDAALQGLIGYRLRQANRAVQADLTETLAPFGLRMITYSVLAVLAEAPGARPSRLADILDVEPPNLVSIVRELEAAGLVRRARAEHDRRAQALHLTVEGAQRHEAAHAAVVRHEQAIFGALDAARLDAFLEVLGMVQDKGDQT